MALRTFKSKLFIISTIVKARRYKILQIKFSKKDGSIFICFPYFASTHGLISLVTYAGGINSSDLLLEPGGRVTSHLVKYAHHPDGQAHFSQDGRIKTEVMKMSVPLSEVNGHLFTAQIQGYQYFESEEHKEIANLRRTYLDFDFKNTEPESVKIVGRLYNKNILENKIVGTLEGPIVPCESNGGEKSVAFLLSDLIEENPKNVLLISCFSIPRIDKENDAALTFIGAFDDSKTVNNKSVDTTLLALSYPINNYDELLSKIGSVDFIR